MQQPHDRQQRFGVLFDTHRRALLGYATRPWLFGVAALVAVVLPANTTAASTRCSPACRCRLGC
jgi:hypothetical protein